MFKIITADNELFFNTFQIWSLCNSLANHFRTNRYWAKSVYFNGPNIILMFVQESAGHHVYTHIYIYIQTYIYIYIYIYIYKYTPQFSTTEVVWPLNGHTIWPGGHNVGSRGVRLGLLAIICHSGHTNWPGGHNVGSSGVRHEGGHRLERLVRSWGRLVQGRQDAYVATVARQQRWQQARDGL